MECCTKTFGDFEVRVPVGDVDVAKELENYNASIIVANELCGEVRKVLKQTYLRGNWGKSVQWSRHLESLARKRYERVCHFGHTVVGLEELTNKAEALSRLNDRVGYRGCLGVFWEGQRLRLEDSVIRPMKEVLNYFVSDPE